MMSKCYNEVLVPVPQELNPSNRDKKKVKALEYFDKNSRVKKMYLFLNSKIGCSVDLVGRFANFAGVWA